MLTGRVTYQAGVNDYIFKSFETISIASSVPGLDSIEIACPNFRLIEARFSFSAAPTEDWAKKTAKMLCDRIFNTISFKYGLSISDPIQSAAEFQYPPTAGQSGGGVAQGTIPLVGPSGCLQDPLDATEIQDLKHDLESPISPKEHYFAMFRQAIQSNSAVDRFMCLYQVLSFIFPNPQGREEQKYVDDFLEQRCGKTRNHPRPGRLGNFETNYSRLRNEIGHHRGVNLEATRTEVESEVFGLAECLQTAITQIP